MATNNKIYSLVESGNHSFMSPPMVGRGRGMRSQLLTTRSELTAFRARYIDKGEIDVELEYLQEASVRAFMSADGEMIGGYAIKRGPRLRYLDQLPAELFEDSGLDASDLCEVTCHWFGRRMSASDRYRAYVQIIVDLIHRGAPRILMATLIRSHARALGDALPHVIFEGTLEVDGRSTWASVRYGTPATLVTGFVSGAARRILRRLGRRVARPFRWRRRVS